MDIGNRTLSMADLQKNTLVSGNKAMQMLELSRHSFEKVVKDGLLTIIYENGKKYYQIGEIEAFMSTDTYTELVNGVVDPRNILNDLTGKDWLPETKSFFYQKGLGANHPEAQIEKLHPAPYSFQDIGHLVNFFTKRGMLVLDPFGGVGSTAKACEVNGRICTSIELSPVWHELSIKRLETEVGFFHCDFASTGGGFSRRTYGRSGPGYPSSILGDDL